jgi:hypothetical protein
VARVVGVGVVVSTPVDDALIAATIAMPQDDVTRQTDSSGVPC